jgi:hypothetical protein
MDETCGEGGLFSRKNLLAGYGVKDHQSIETIRDLYFQPSHGSGYMICTVCSSLQIKDFAKVQYHLQNIFVVRSMWTRGA